MILWWKVRFPGIRVLLSKKDIKDAFRWIMVHEADACLFGADLEGKEWNVPATIVAVYWVLTFGWTGSPGEWMVWAWVVKAYHAAFAPADPAWDDRVSFHSLFLMDDQVLVEPDLGTRGWQSVEATEDGGRAGLRSWSHQPGQGP